MNNRLLYLLLCLLLMFIGGAILPVYADDGQHHDNQGGIGHGPGGNGPNYKPLDGNHPVINPWQHSENKTPPAWGRSENMTPPAWGRSENKTPPAWGRSENKTPPAWGRSPSDNITSLSENITRHQPPWRGSDNNTASPWSKLAQILNIDEGTLMNALRQVFGPFMK